MYLRIFEIYHCIKQEILIIYLLPAILNSSQLKKINFKYQLNFKEHYNHTFSLVQNLA